MATDRLTRRERTKRVFVVVAVAIIASALLAIALFYMSQTMPRF